MDMCSCQNCSISYCKIRLNPSDYISIVLMDDQLCNFELQVFGKAVDRVHEFTADC